MMVSTSPILGGTLLIVAGIFQFAPFKNSCLSYCRSPLSFLMTDWREGRLGALIMGLKHGVHCTGCCWFLMLLLFVAGVMNIWWIAILSIFVLLEKVVPKAHRFSRVSGVVLILWGGWLLLFQDRVVASAL
jgi:predicted metal-binding membrane protein